METVMIETESINLDQLLKWANVVSSGGEAKHLIITGQVMLNNEVETRRGKKVFKNDIIVVGERKFRVI